MFTCFVMDKVLLDPDPVISRETPKNCGKTSIKMYMVSERSLRTESEHCIKNGVSTLNVIVVLRFHTTPTVKLPVSTLDFFGSRELLNEFLLQCNVV